MTRLMSDLSRRDPTAPLPPKWHIWDPPTPILRVLHIGYPLPQLQCKSKTRISYMENTPLVFLNSHPPGGI
jgi:hypothetical protein